LRLFSGQLSSGTDSRKLRCSIKTGHIASLSIPQHREVAPGTLRSLIRAAGMTVDEFLRFC